MTVTVAVAYWRDDGFYPRAVRARRRSTPRGDVYLHNTATMVATWQRVSSLADTSFVLCTNQRPTGAVAHELEALGVEHREVTFESRPPEGFFDRFSASTYSLDVLRALGRTMAPSDVLVLVDPDVVWLRDPAPLVARARDVGLVVHDIAYRLDHRDLGLTRRELTEVVASMSGVEAPRPLPHVGGELVVVTGRDIGRLVAACDEAWAASLRRFEQGVTPRLNTEEHVLTYAFHVLGYEVGRSTTHEIHRVWTRPGRLRNVTGDELDAIAWHALTEKAWGLWGLFDDLVARAGAFAEGLDDDTYRRRLARRLSVDPTPWTRLRLLVGREVYRLKGFPVHPMPR